jgi:hypothetical protein
MKGCPGEPDRNEDRESPPLKILTGLGEGSKRGWRTNELGGGGTEDQGNFRNRSRQGCRGQNRSERNRLGADAGMSGRADRAGMVRRSRIFRMRVGRLYRPHHAHQGDTEHANCPYEYAPI